MLYALCIVRYQKEMVLISTIKRVLCRLMASVVFAVIWFLYVTSYITLAAPFAFFAMLYFAAAWMNYLRYSGLPVFLKSRETAHKAELSEDDIKNRLNSDDTENSLANQTNKANAKVNFAKEAKAKADALLAIKVNLISAALLVVVTFIITAPFMFM